MVVIPNPIVAASSRQRFRDIAMTTMPPGRSSGTRTLISPHPGLGILASHGQAKVGVAEWSEPLRWPEKPLKLWTFAKGRVTKMEITLTMPLPNGQFGAAMEFRSTLFALQNIIEAAILDSPLSGIGPSTRAVLLEIGRLVSGGRIPNIGDLVNNRDLGSPVTVLKRLRELEATGWIMILRSSTEHRVKEIYLSDDARRSFEVVGHTVERSMFKGLGTIGAEKVTRS
jgi:hypothetical protein